MTIKDAPHTALHRTGPSAAETDYRRCREMLARKHEGRLGYDSGRGHRAVAVNYSVARDSSIIVSAASYSEIGRYAPGARVAFDLEEIDEAISGIWQVHITGIAEKIEDAAISELGIDGPPERWPSGVAATSLRIPLTEVSCTLISRRSGRP